MSCEAVRGSWLGLLGQLRLRDTQPAQGPMTIAIDTPRAPVHLVSSDHEFEIRRGRPAAADVRLSGQPRLIGGYLGGLLSLDEARSRSRRYGGSGLPWELDSIAVWRWPDGARLNRRG